MSGEQVDAEELLVHIKGIKFHNPEFGYKRITKELQKLGEAFRSVKEKRVHRLMKKHGLLQNQLDEDNKAAGVLRLMTVGDSSRPYQADTLPSNDSTEWVPVKLNVPCELSGKFPYQATISMQHCANNSKPEPKTGHIYKIQAAQGQDKQPMLLYSQDRSKSTYIHPGSTGYDVIHDIVRAAGVEGVNGAGGGVKSYFYGKFDKSFGAGVLLVYVKETAPLQAW